MEKWLEKIFNVLMSIFSAISKNSKGKPVLIGEEPDRPNKTAHYDIPKIVVVPEVKFKTHGEYRTKSGKARGLIVHYTVSGRSEKSARGVLRYLASRGLGCMVMDENGVIYLAGNVDLEKSVAWHAGKSAWQGKTGISRYCMGMEICNWGRLSAQTEPRAGDTRSIPHKYDNIAPGKYEKFTRAQEQALVDFIKWQLDTNPEFELDWVVGHDEVAPTRKTDPGGSLSLSMPRFRESFKANAEVKLL